jgi:hypothetical protein
VTHDGIRALAGALRRSNQREAARRGTGRYEAVVLSVEPLRLDPIGLDGDLDDDDVTIGGALAAHLDDEPLEVDDVLVLIENADHDYNAVEVVRG